MSFFDPFTVFPHGCPDGMIEVMLESLLFAFFGTMLFIGSARFEMTYDKPAKWWKWCFVPLGVALLFGIQRMYFLHDFLYLSTVSTRKQLWSHYLALIIPILCIGGIILFKSLKKRNVESRVY